MVWKIVLSTGMMPWMLLRVNMLLRELLGAMNENATGGATSSGDVTVGPAYINKKAKTLKNKDGTSKNALDVKDANLLTGMSFKKR